jgi:anaphase-promoting complex subunit 2
LHGENYRVPDNIVKLQKRYEQGFESLKNSRKLTWLHGLGQATVELELEDRVVFEEVHTWQATVIWAFQSNHGEDSSITRNVEELVEHLEMDETFVRSALKFWASKMVLREIRKDEYAVLETLNQEDRARSDAQAVAAVTTAENNADDNTLMSNDALTSEKMQMYWQFIQGMLTNSSPQMPLQQIAMMLKMLIVDGFPYSNEELQEFLGLKVVAGELDFIAGKYKLKK